MFIEGLAFTDVYDCSWQGSQKFNLQCFLVIFKQLRFKLKVAFFWQEQQKHCWMYLLFKPIQNHIHFSPNIKLSSWY